MAKEKKETTSEYFIQLGMKFNGKIVANQQHELNKFMNHIVEDCSMVTEIKISLWDRIFHPKRQKKKLSMDIEKMGIDVLRHTLQHFKELIIEDYTATELKKFIASSKKAIIKKGLVVKKKKPVKRGKK